MNQNSERAPFSNADSKGERHLHESTFKMYDLVIAIARYCNAFSCRIKVEGAGGAVPKTGGAY